MLYKYKPRGVCARKMEIELDGDVVRHVNVVGGCNGNSQGLSRIVEGMTVNEVKDKLTGIKCNMKSSSCPDQMAIAISEAYEESKKKAE